MRIDWTTMGGLAVVAFTAEPNWTVAPKLTLSIADSLTASQSNKTFARSFSVTGKYVFDYEAYCGTIDQSTDLRLGLQRLKDEPVVMPLWVDCVKTTASLSTSQFTVLFDLKRPPSRWGRWWIIINTQTFLYELIRVTNVDLSAGQLTFATWPTNNWPAGTTICPVMMGAFTKRPVFTNLTEWLNTVKLEFSETCPMAYAITPAPQSFASVQSELGLSVPARLFDPFPQYTGQAIDQTVADIDFQQIGFGHEDVEFAYPQGPRRVTELAFVDADRPVISRIEAIFMDRLGRALNMWVPTWRNDVQLVAQTPFPSDHHIVGVDPLSRYFDTAFDTEAGFGYFALNDTQGNLECFLITPASSGGTFVATTPITQEFDPPDKISALILSRFQENKLQWEYVTDRYAKTTIKFLEMTEEYLYTPTNQALAYCYVFEEQLVDGSIFSYFTSFESPLVVPGLGTFQPGPFDAGKIKTSINMGDDSCEMVSFIFAGNPLMKLFPFTIEADLYIKIYEVDRNSMAFTWIFEGTAELLKTEGAKFTTTIKAWGSTFDQQFHRHVIASACPYVVYSVACGVNINSFFLGATFVSQSGQTVTLNVGFGARLNQFIQGVLKIPASSGQPMQIRGIIWSTAVTGGQILVQLQSPLNGTIPPGTAVQLAPGCDGSTSVLTGCQFFNNLPRYGGEPTVPVDANPSVSAVNASDGGGSKK